MLCSAVVLGRVGGLPGAGLQAGGILSGAVGLGWWGRVVGGVAGGVAGGAHKRIPFFSEWNRGTWVYADLAFHFLLLRAQDTETIRGAGRRAAGGGGGRRRASDPREHAGAWCYAFQLFLFKLLAMQDGRREKESAVAHAGVDARREEEGREDQVFFVRSWVVAGGGSRGKKNADLGRTGRLGRVVVVVIGGLTLTLQLRRAKRSRQLKAVLGVA